MSQRTSRYVGHFGQCESFWVENVDQLDGLYARREAMREQRRRDNRQREIVYAEELSKLTADEYQDDVLAHMQYMEGETMADVSSIDQQDEIQWFMRPYLLDFLVEAHMAFQLLPETLYLAVNLLDRYCSKRVVYKRHYQLVGCAALLIAAKYGDRKERVPQIRELKSMCCSLYDDEMFTQMEWHVLQTLEWIIGHPTVDGFLQLALTEREYDPEVEHLTWYICEIALFHKEFVSTRPSVMARSALALARCILGRPQLNTASWTGTYDPLTVVNLSHRLYTPSQVLSRKYTMPNLSGVAAIVEEFLRQQAQAQRPVSNTPQIVTPIEEEKSYMDTYATAPSTPQKHLGSVMQHGQLTPPITPEHDMFDANGIPKPNNYVAYPATPSPSGHLSHPHPPSYHYYAQPQAMQ